MSITISNPEMPLPSSRAAALAANERGVRIMFEYVKYSNFCIPSIAEDRIAVVMPGSKPRAARKK